MCEHHDLACTTCGHQLALPALEDRAVALVVRDAIDRFHGADWLLTSLEAAHTVYEAAVRRRHEVGVAPSWSSVERSRRHLRPTSPAAVAIADAVADERARWQSGTVTALPSPAERAAELADARRRHPTSRPAPAGATPAPPIPQEQTA